MGTLSAREAIEKDAAVEEEVEQVQSLPAGVPDDVPLQVIFSPPHKATFFISASDSEEEQTRDPKRRRATPKLKDLAQARAFKDDAKDSSSGRGSPAKKRTRVESQQPSATRSATHTQYSQSKVAAAGREGRKTCRPAEKKQKTAGRPPCSTSIKYYGGRPAQKNKRPGRPLAQPFVILSAGGNPESKSRAGIATCFPTPWKFPERNEKHCCCSSFGTSGEELGTPSASVSLMPSISSGTGEPTKSGRKRVRKTKAKCTPVMEPELKDRTKQLELFCDTNSG